MGEVLAGFADPAAVVALSVVEPAAASAVVPAVAATVAPAAAPAAVVLALLPVPAHVLALAAVLA
ncbi:hypothetical protein MF406_16885 [Georgenia sp. TF02-10]|uniref:hypothetical protein n=1 Tax=Georgenia sp. TF02-10 TaxID=2917725 RepID=UPI001FA7AFC1|nr:hypothetical protein [Georgenia sp. TF02-10]UNX54539.1 hypothetical protein MF406_16885 [Georgenia sp. TF02-10]